VLWAGVHTSYVRFIPKSKLLISGNWRVIALFHGKESSFHVNFIS
jgi:hypothetical protein